MNDNLSSRLLERITGSNAARHLLRRFFDEGRMKKALDVLAGERRATSLSCYMASGALRILTMIGSTAFGVSDSLIRENLSNSIFRRAFSSVVKGLTSFGMTRPFVPGAPFQIVWNVTRACNLKCQHCYENAGKREPDELTTEEAIACIDKLVNAGVVLLAFSGGEPTLREDILELIRRSSMKGMYVAIATNGLTFSNRKRVQEFKRAGLSFVQISLDGCNPETHDAFRGVPGAFARTLQGIRNCVDEGLFVEVAMTATKNNIAQVEDTIDIASNIGAQWFMLYNFVPTGRGKEIIECDLSPDEREDLLLVLWERIMNKEAHQPIEVLSTAPQLGRIARTCNNDASGEEDLSIFPTHFSNARLPEGMKDLASFIGGCGAGRFYLAIEPNGDIYPCVFFPHTPEVCLGNIRSCDLDHLWRSSRVLYQLRTRSLLKGNCGSCSNQDVCGGCRARAKGYFDDYLAPDPGCIKNQDAWCSLTQDGPLEHSHLLISPILPAPSSDSENGVV